jgi:hypothetical protein
MKLSRRDQTILGIGIALCGALFLLAGTTADGVGLVFGIVGIAVLGSRPAVADVADHRTRGWTLIGALMVMLHEHEAGTPTRPATVDADAVVDARGATGATGAMATLLHGVGSSIPNTSTSMGTATSPSATAPWSMWSLARAGVRAPI